MHTHKRINYLHFTAFASGCISLSLELSASRLLAPVFGTTEIVWTAIIGLILLYLSVGYVLGGRWADRKPYADVVYTIMTSAGIVIALIPPSSRPLLQTAVNSMRLLNLGQLAGPLMAILVLFAVPVTLLATVSPFVIRLSINDLNLSGKTAGRIYAISTAGSIIGAFLPNLVLIPKFGTWRTFILLAGVCVMTGLGGLWVTNRKRFWLFTLFFPAIVLLYIHKPDVIKTGTNILHEQESAYNYIQVVEAEEQRRYLLLNEGQGIHSVYTSPELLESDPFAILTGGPWDYFLVAPFFNSPPFDHTQVNSLLVIGLAAGTTATQFNAFYGAKPIDGVEIDPGIVDVGKRYFNMHLPNLQVHIEDGRTFLTATQNHYSLIVVDAYRLPYIPWHLTTVQFFQQVYDHLDETGTLAINVGHTPTNWLLVDAIANTMHNVFPSVHIINVPDSLNAVVIATKQPSSSNNLSVNLPNITEPRLLEIARRAVQQLRTPGTSSNLFTDDRAPVEQMSHTLALRYILTGE